MIVMNKESGDPDCSVCNGDGEILVSQSENGESDFMGHFSEPCPMCMSDEN